MNEEKKLPPVRGASFMTLTAELFTPYFLLPSVSPTGPWPTPTAPFKSNSKHRDLEHGGEVSVLVGRGACGP